MRIAHPCDVHSKLISYFTIVKVSIAIGIAFPVAGTPRAEMKLVNAKRSGVKMTIFIARASSAAHNSFTARGKPSAVMPFVTTYVIYD